ncbi:hypothetical protein ACA910_017498 [Epithemia clementina (nom. ined.)]
MRVDLSSWETTHLSIPNRRRKTTTGPIVAAATDHHDGNSNGNKDIQLPTVVASFVTSELTAAPRRPSKRSKSVGPSLEQEQRQEDKQHENFVPYLVVTGENRIVVVGRKGKHLEESQSLQYECRPGTRFLPQNNAAAAAAAPGSLLPCIPAVLDWTNGRLFGLQNNNRRLLSWRMTSTPDHAQHYYSALNGTASISSLSLLSLLSDYSGGEGRSIVYGTLDSQELYIASCDDDQDDEGKNGMRFQRFGALSTTVGHPRSLRHVATTAALSDTPNKHTEEPSQNKKRSMTPEREEPTIFFYQIFADKTQLIHVRHSLSCSKLLEFSESQARQEKCLPVISTIYSPDAEIESAQLIGVSREGGEDLAVVSLRIQGILVVVAVSLTNGRILEGGFHMPSATNFVALGHHEYGLATNEGSDLCLYDFYRGYHLARHSVREIFSDDDDDKKTNGKDTAKLQCLWGDATNERLFILSESDDGFYSLGMCSLHSNRRYRLADAIAAASSLPRGVSLAPVIHIPDDDDEILGKLKGEDATDGGEDATPFVDSNQILLNFEHQQRVQQKACELLQAAKISICQSLEDGDGHNLPNDYLTTKVNEAVVLILGVENNKPESEENPPKKSEENLKARKRKSSDKKMNGVNGVVASAMRNGVAHQANEDVKLFSHSQEKIWISETNPQSPSFEKLESYFLDEMAFVTANLIISLKDGNPKSSHLESACAILRKAVRTGKMNARALSQDENGDSDLIGRLLRSLPACQGKAKPAYNSSELINDMLRHCQDISEHQLVQMIHHLLFFESPNNMAAIILAEKEQLHPDHKTLSTCERHYRSHTGNKPTNPELKLLSSRITVMGACLFMKQIVGYSGMNGSLLRRALLQMFSRRKLLMLARFVPKFIASVETSAVVFKRLIQFVSALCDCIYASGPLSKEESRSLDSLHEMLKKEATFIHALLPFDAALQGINLKLSSGAGQRIDTPEDQSGPTPVARYQIERLIF